MTNSDKCSGGKDKKPVEKRPEVPKNLEDLKNKACDAKKKLSEKLTQAIDLNWIKNQSEGLKAKIPDPKALLATLKQKIALKNIDFKTMISNFSFSDAVQQIKCTAIKMSEGAPVGRPMKFPYTFSAKIAQFPMKFYVQNQWIWRYYAISFAACIPLFYSIHKLANSPGNVAKWAEIRRKEAMEHHH